MLLTLDAILDALIKREGAFSHLVADKGGATKYGITQTTLAHYRQQPVSIEDVKALDIPEAKAIYTELFVARPHIDALSGMPFYALMVDFAVTSGPSIAIAALQECLSIKGDGILGPRTLAAIVTRNPVSVNNELVKWRAMMLVRICRRDVTQLQFLGGWMTRTLGFIV